MANLGRGTRGVAHYTSWWVVAGLVDAPQPERVHFRHRAREMKALAAYGAGANLNWHTVTGNTDISTAQVKGIQLSVATTSLFLDRHFSPPSLNSTLLALLPAQSNSTSSAFGPSGMGSTPHVCSDIRSRSRSTLTLLPGAESLPTPDQQPHPLGSVSALSPLVFNPPSCLVACELCYGCVCASRWLCRVFTSSTLMNI